LQLAPGPHPSPLFVTITDGKLMSRVGVSQDYAAALRWFQKAADQGDHTAQFNLGVMYTIGRGVLQDYAAAMSWYRKAADQGDAEAQFNVGVIYANGEGVPRERWSRCRNAKSRTGRGARPCSRTTKCLIESVAEG
jgi:TPR repeat protein